MRCSNVRKVELAWADAGMSAKRKHIMSINYVPNITLRAYQLWDAAGRPQGRDEEFYYQAEEEFRQQLEQGVGNAERERTNERGKD
jgi:Protein of unknown function (DUF2934)